MTTYKDMSNKSSINETDDNKHNITMLRHRVGQLTTGNEMLDFKICQLLRLIDIEKQTKKPKKNMITPYQGGAIQPFVVVNSIRKKR